MLSVLIVILVLVYWYRLRLNQRLDRSQLVHSSYYELSYGGEKKCTKEAASILSDVSGYKKILLGWKHLEKNGPVSADIILLHETGIYVFETKEYAGWISGGMEEEYWVQTLSTGKYTSCQNYFYNPMLKMEGCIACMQKELPDMNWLPYYRVAVFGDGCELENAGLTDRESKIIHLRQLSYTIYGMIRSAHKFLAPQVIDEIYARLCTPGACEDHSACRRSGACENVHMPQKHESLRP